MSYRIADLFSGAGGMTLGFADQRFGGGFVPVFGVDNDSAAVRTHETNFAGHSILANIEEWISKTEIPAADVVVGGPPCQGFSLLNRGRDGDQRRALWEPYLEVVKSSGAKIFVMENVAELFRSPELVEIRARAKELGFETIASVLNTANFGAPQARKRTIVIGWDTVAVPLGVEMPMETHIDPASRSSSNLPVWKTVRDAISDLPGDAIGVDFGLKPPLDLHFGRTPTEKSQKRYRAVPPGGNRFDLYRNAPELTPDCWIRKTSGGTDLFGRLWWDRPSVTIRTEFFKPEKGRYLHPVEHRPITHREAARLMGFPDDFKFCGSKVEVARQIGNAVPPPFAGAIAKTVRDALDRAALGKNVKKAKAA
ncbi:DNA cytosine methyltransferase [Endobacterium cereale]|uniref:DNA cytosine methyltransferase n=1 Tax=Endobacterium cereale TaxID=2663029 RepID=UPI002B4AA5AE|nr:DNA cytosine methyltransferase [Endobacterium cereale]MEB2846806.1 DNA cytosine methyltransferase [Endobacterium cereale]